MNTGLLGQRLIAGGQLKPADLERALEFQQAHGGRLGAILVRMGAVTEEALYQTLAEQLGYRLVAPDELDLDAVQAGRQRLEPRRAWLLRHQVLAWSGPEERLQLASADPLDPDLRETLDADAATAQATWRLIRPADAERWLHRLREGEAQAAPLDAQTLRELAEDAPVIAFVNNIIAQAVEARASDIHLEPGEREFEVRLRVDGVLHTRLAAPMARYPAIASRIKLVAQIDIAERRLPQDGRITVRAAGQEMDIRVSSIPAVHGESLVLRLLPRQRADLHLDRLGMEADQLPEFRRWLGWPNGLVLVTGPTGSGKSTTLYSALAAINDRSRKIVTVEDPVEFRLPHLVQIQTQAEIGYSFARALRAILRHDPDIIMVGEIRDRETAEIAIQSALTGHLVLATLHTNDALSSITRLTDMGIEPYLVAAALRAVMAQRLVRRLCSCARPDEPPEALQARWLALAPRLPAPLRPEGEPRWRAAGGCPACQETGFRGRVGIYELVALGDAMQHAVAAGAPLAEIERLADAAGRRSLREDGLLKVAQGLSTWDEVLRAAGGLSAD